MRTAAQRRLAVGFFDGVHLGHRRILEGADVALTFDRHPLAVLAPERAPQLIMTLDERLTAIRACGVGETVVVPFTAETAALSPERFIAERLAGATAVRCGTDWRFGCGGAGDAALVRSAGIPVEVVPAVEYDGGRISSSRIRSCLAQGDLASAAAMLGRPFAIRGKAVPGKGLGGRIGFPTVNLVADGPVFPIPRGVYVVTAGGIRAIANWGLAPTAGAAAWREPVLEVHFPAGGPVPFDAVELVDFVRPERTFASIDELREQIARDCERVKA